MVHQPCRAPGRRRQTIDPLRLEQCYTQRDLVNQVDALLSETDGIKAIPTALYQSVDVIRNFGDFLAHRITDQTTLQIIPVEPEEAEWCLNILVLRSIHMIHRSPAQLCSSLRLRLNRLNHLTGSDHLTGSEY